MNTAEPTPTCPQCGSNKLYKDGLRYLADGTTVQRWLCRECGYRFTNPNHKSQSRWKNPPFNLNLQNCINNNCQGNDEPVGGDPTSLGRLVQTLATVEKEEKTKSGQAGAAKTEKADIRGKIVEYLWYLKKKGLKETSVNDYGYKLGKLVEAGVNLLNPEDVKEYLAKRNDWSQRTKATTVVIYDGFARWLGLAWDPPCYKPVRKYPYIPTEEEINQLIAASGKKLATFLQLLKETGMRCGEAANLKWADIDFARKFVKITPEKGSDPRILPISDYLIGMLNNLPRKSDKVFKASLTSIKTNFFIARKKIARKLNNPRLMEISFHTLRHWKATMEYHRTKDIIYVQQLLGHRDIKSTMLYIYLEKQLFQSVNDDSFHVRVAKTPEEIKALLEVGFEYVLEKDGLLFFRKRK
jgi:integrase